MTRLPRTFYVAIVFLTGGGSRCWLSISAREEKDQEVQGRDHEEKGKRPIY
jgi:hypothetical protein